MSLSLVICTENNSSWVSVPIYTQGFSIDTSTGEGRVILCLLHNKSKLKNDVRVKKNFQQQFFVSNEWKTRSIKKKKSKHKKIQIFMVKNASLLSIILSKHTFF